MPLSRVRITSLLSRSSRFLGKAITKIYSPYISELEKKIGEKLFALGPSPELVYIVIVDEEDEFFHNRPNNEDIYHVNVGWMLDNYDQPRDAVAAIKLVARKARQVFSRAPFLPSDLRQSVVDDVGGWEDWALAAEGRKAR